MKHLLLTTIAAVVMLLFGGVNEVNADPLTYEEVVGDTVTITDCDENASGALVIPSSYQGKPVTKIGESAFWGCSSLTSVTIGDSVTSIGKYAFRYCKSLTGVTIPDSVTSIGESAFWGCSSLTSIEVGKGNSEYSSEDGVLFDKYETVLIQFPAGKSGHYTIPDSVTIGKSAFKNCSSLTSVTIPDSFTSIWSWAFQYCSSLTSITIPDSVNSIGEWAFYDCSSLTNIYFESNAPSIRWDVFREVSKNAKIFVNPSATGFGETFAGLPVQILEKTLKINTFSKSASPFSLTFETQSDSTYKIEASHDLKKWGEIGEVQGTGSSVELTDWREALFQKQYYRVKMAE